ncbi:helix-turn-helix domain-containing protein [Acinetobacter gerneri]|uniref:helix-turn-helix domain-containing protein n=1 Tax=Acinetobacter gerneri TaxID=202952 RepID=UPI003213FEAF
MSLSQSPTLFNPEFFKSNHGKAYNKAITVIEKALFENVLISTRGNMTKAAEILGINRGTLRKKLIALGLHHFQKES